MVSLAQAIRENSNAATPFLLHLRHQPRPTPRACPRFHSCWYFFGDCAVNRRCVVVRARRFCMTAEVICVEGWDFASKRPEWIWESNPLKCGLEYQEAEPGFVLPKKVGITSAWLNHFYPINRMHYLPHFWPHPRNDKSIETHLNRDIPRPLL